MTNRAAPFIIAGLVSLIVWAVIAQMVLGDSRQTCERTASADVCAWELR